MTTPMRRLLLGTTLALGLLVPQPAVAAPGDSAAVVRLDGVRVELREGTSQVVTVDHTRGVRARVSLWRLTRDGWKRQLSTRDGRTGYGGLVDGAPWRASISVHAQDDVEPSRTLDDVAELIGLQLERGVRERGVEVVAREAAE